MDSNTYNLGPLVMPAANFAGSLDRPSDVILGPIVGVTAAMVPAKKHTGQIWIMTLIPLKV